MSDPTFRLLFVAPGWAARDTPGAILEEEEIPLEFEAADRVHTAEVFARHHFLHSRLAKQLAVEVLADSDRPEITVGSDAHFAPMCRFEDPISGRVLWIDKGKWKKDRNAHEAPSSESAGHVRIRVGSARISIRFDMPGFEQDEYAQLLDEFKGELWELVADDQAVTLVPRRAEVAGFDVVALVAAAKRVAAAARAIRRRPKSKVASVVAQLPRWHVRPTVETLRALTMRGPKRVLPRLVYENDTDTVENRYAYWLVIQTGWLCDRVLEVRRRQRARLKDLEASLEQRAITLETESIPVDPREFDDFVELEQRRVRRMLDQAVADLCTICSSSHRVTGGESKLWTLRFRTRKPLWTSTGIDYRVAIEVIELINYRGKAQPPPGQPITLSFPRSVYRLRLFGTQGAEFELKAKLSQAGVDGAEQQNVTTNRHVDEVLECRWLRWPLLDDLPRMRAELESNGWRRRRASREEDRDQLKADKDVVALRRTKVRTLLGQVAREEPELEAASRLVATARRDLELLVSRSVRVAPGSVTFLRHRHYRRLIEGFRAALDAGHLGVELLDALFEEKWTGVRQFSDVYELWVLLRLLRSLREDFGFQFEQVDWRERLVAVVARGAREHVEFSLANPLIGRAVTLHYQLRLDQPTRKMRGGSPIPDFCLDVRVTSNDHRPVTRRIVLDAKSKKYAPLKLGETAVEVPPSDVVRFGQTVRDDLDELINTKNYDQGGMNPVFILHPSPDALAVASDHHLATPRARSHYGGDGRLSAGDAAPLHRRGAVLVRPELDPLAGRTDPDSLRRLLQLLLEWLPFQPTALRDAKGRFDPLEGLPSPFCPGCQGKVATEQGKTEGKNLKYSLRCQAEECGQRSYLNSCGTCHTRLFKHGAALTYHETHVLNAYNIRCPSCGDYARETATGAEPSKWGSKSSGPDEEFDAPF